MSLRQDIKALYDACFEKEKYGYRLTALGRAAAGQQPQREIYNPYPRLDRIKEHWVMRPANILEKQQKKRDPVSYALGALPPKIVFDTFGKEMYLFTLLRYGILDENHEAYQNVLEQFTGITPTSWEKARLTQWRIHDYDEYTVDQVTAKCSLFAKLQKKNVGLNTGKIIISCSKTKDTAPFGVSGVFPRGTWTHSWTDEFDGKPLADLEGNGYRVYMDASAGILLTYDGLPFAITAFDLCGKAMMIHQLQGVIYKKKDGTPVKGSPGIGRIDWERCSVELSIALAKEMNCSTLWIKSGHNNPWAKPDNKGETHTTLERAVARYDGTAQRLGFRQSACKNWYLPLAEYDAKICTRSLNRRYE